MKVLLSALPSVATSPLALIAYIFVIIAWILISLKVKRNRQLLMNLDKLPEQDRLRALEMEMAVVKLKSGLNPEQWLKNKSSIFNTNQQNIL